jgi:hypothetical protein
MNLAPGDYESPLGVALLPRRAHAAHRHRPGCRRRHAHRRRPADAGRVPDPQLNGDGNADGKDARRSAGNPRVGRDPVVLPDGRFWAAGVIRDGAGNDQTVLARFGPSGALDTTYEGTGFRIVSKPGQKQWNSYALTSTPGGGLLAPGDAWDGCGRPQR